MKNVLVFVDYLDNLAFDAVRDQLNKGNEVFILYCSQSTQICKANYGKTPLICKLCVHETRKKLKDFNNESNCHITSMDELMTPEIMEIANQQEFHYNDTDSLKALKYKGIDIGYAAFSTFVSVTRNVMPTYNDYLKSYLDDVMRSCVRMIEAQQNYYDKVNPDLVIFHNGRHSNLKSIFRIAEQRGISFICTERQWTKDGEDVYDLFVGNVPQTGKAKYDKMQYWWENGLENKVEVSEAFFSNRKFGKFAGDKIYTANQVQGKLPDGFDKSKRNISIFNSSEDEYCSISTEMDNGALFKSQYEALKTIFDHYKDDNSIHFYLRIHPNLGEVPYKSHTMLYNLKYDNVTIFPPESPVSSYALMDNSEKVLVFVSSMGLESTYWGKPVIALNEYYYSFMNIVHTPKSEMELFEMIDNPNLPNLKNDECLKAAYYFLGGPQEKLRYYPTVKKRTTIGPFVLETFSQFTLFGSKLFLALILKILRIGTHIGVIGKYDHLGAHTI